MFREVYSGKQSRIDLLRLTRCLSSSTRLVCFNHSIPVASLCLCAVESAVRFDGASYLRYLHWLDEDDQDFKVSLRFKTFQEHSFLVATNGTSAWGTLQVPGSY